MSGPYLKAPQEPPGVAKPFRPMLCNACGKTLVPDPALTCLGDLVLRMGGFCSSCGVLCCLLEVTSELALRVRPGDFLLYDQRFPPKDSPFPWPRRGFFDMKDFPYGANAHEEST